MARRYVFWTRPDGKLNKQDKERYAPTQVLRLISENAFVANGGVSWNSIDVRRWELALKAGVSIVAPTGQRLNESDAWKITWAAVRRLIVEAGGRTSISPTSVIDAADAEAARHFRKPLKDYVLVTSLSVTEFPAREISIRGCRIAALKERGTRYPHPATLARQVLGTPAARHIESTGYQTIRVKTQARTEHAAVDAALDSIALLRGFWTLISTYRNSSLHFGYGVPRVGVIHIGPFHTLHNPDGSTVNDLYWYEPDYTADEDLYEPRSGWNPTERSRRRTIRKLQSCPFRHELEHLIIRYAYALDHSNLDVAFLQLWALLESITGTIELRYDETIKRAAWIYKDRAACEELLQMLRRRRNQYVHAAASGDNQQEVAYLIKSLIEPHLIELIRNDIGVRSLEEYSDFLAMSGKEDALRRRESMARRARQFLKSVGALG